jgi:7-cyano-7-deazaguanine synthase
MDRAVVLLSGGLDSATVLYIAMENGFDVYALSFEYGQRHDQELNAARRLAKSAGVKDHLVAYLDPRLFLASSLTGGGEVPAGRKHPEREDSIPSTYVPARNTVFLSLAMAYAETIGAGDVYIGVNALDYSGYPDCRPEFIRAFRNLAEVATKEGVMGNPTRIRAPLQNMTKAQIIARGLELGVDYSLTHSCYSPDSGGRACGRCDACILRQRGFMENGITDPIPYSKENG